MSDANREAIERMFARVVAAARKFGMPNEEIQLIVEIELFGEAVPAGAEEKAPEVSSRAPASKPEQPKPGPDELIPELEEAEPNWEAKEGETAVLPDGSPVTLESLGIGRVERPVQLQAPPHTKNEKDLMDGMGDR